MLEPNESAIGEHILEGRNHNVKFDKPPNSRLRIPIHFQDDLWGIQIKKTSTFNFFSVGRTKK